MATAKQVEAAVAGRIQDKERAMVKSIDYGTTGYARLSDGEAVYIVSWRKVAGVVPVALLKDGREVGQGAFDQVLDA